MLEILVKHELSAHKNQSRYIYRGYPAKRALSDIRKHGRVGPFWQDTLDIFCTHHFHCIASHDFNGKSAGVIWNIHENILPTREDVINEIYDLRRDRIWNVFASKNEAQSYKSSLWHIRCFLFISYVTSRQFSHWWWKCEVANLMRVWNDQLLCCMCMTVTLYRHVYIKQYYLMWQGDTYIIIGVYVWHGKMTIEPNQTSFALVTLRCGVVVGWASLPQGASILVIVKAS